MSKNILNDKDGDLQSCSRGSEFDPTGRSSNNPGACSTTIRPSGGEKKPPRPSVELPDWRASFGVQLHERIRSLVDAANHGANSSVFIDASDLAMLSSMPEWMRTFAALHFSVGDWESGPRMLSLKHARAKPTQGKWALFSGIAKPARPAGVNAPTNPAHLHWRRDCMAPHLC